MENSKYFILLTALMINSLLCSPLHGQITEAFTKGSFSGDFNLRLETVSQDNALKDAEAFTLRSLLAFTTAEVSGFSAHIGFKDVRIVLGVDDYTVGPTGFNPGEYSVIADPETTELDQGYLQYKNDVFLARVGPQVIVYDNHRFIGHVGWRQDRQTFDALTLALTPNEKLSLNYNFLDKRRRIFAEEADVDSADHIVHGSYQTSLGSVTTYAYLLEAQSPEKNSLDTLGIRFTGAREIGGFNTSYQFEYASQESTTGNVDFDADYFLIELGTELWEGVTAKLAYEEMGSDDGLYGFSTPLSTLHAHNGWADIFLSTPNAGLNDRYFKLDGKWLASSWSIVLHDFQTVHATAMGDDLGMEWDAQWLFPVSSSSTVGIKYASYSADDASFPRSDTDKFWLWFNFKF